jgi:5-methylcytosine-specific restriction endonuclease McrA
MGLPRYLQNKYGTLLRFLACAEDTETIELDRVDVGELLLMGYAQPRRDAPLMETAQLAQYAIKQKYGFPRPRLRPIDPYASQHMITVQMPTGAFIRERDEYEGNYYLIPETKPVEISSVLKDRFYAMKRRKIEMSLKERELEEKKAETLAQMRTIVGVGRRWPDHLRTYILWYYDSTCSDCGLTPEKINEMKKIDPQYKNQIEVDHRIEYEDGGQTTFDNAVVRCQRCNNGKNKAKKHLLRFL